MDYRGFYSWEKMITFNYQIIFERATPEQQNGVKVPAKDRIPDELNWVALVNRLANDDITKHKDIYELNYEQCLIQLAWWHHRDKYAAQVQRQIERKNK